MHDWMDEAVVLVALAPESLADNLAFTVNERKHLLGVGGYLSSVHNDTCNYTAKVGKILRRHKKNLEWKQI
jgi:hypothetical protein